MANPIKQIFAKRSERSAANLFEFEGAVPVSKSILFSLQHLLALFVSNIAPIIVLVAAVQGSNPDLDAKILENGVRVATLLAGIGTLLQMFPLWKFGGRLPVFMGASFTFLGVLELIVSTYSWQTAFLSVVIDFSAISLTVIINCSFFSFQSTILYILICKSCQE